MIYTPADANGEFRYADDLHTLTVTAIVATKEWYDREHVAGGRRPVPLMGYIHAAVDNYLPADDLYPAVEIEPPMAFQSEVREDDYHWSGMGRLDYDDYDPHSTENEPEWYGKGF